MEHLDFTLFSEAVNTKFQSMANNKDLVLAVTTVDSEVLYDVYLEAYPKAVNGIFRERRHYDGTYDKNFIRRIGDVVSIDKNGKLDTIWNVTVPGYFQQVADAMHQFVLHHQPMTAFLTDMSVAGNKANRDNVEDIIWNHFHSVIPSAYVVKRMHLGAQIGRFNEDVGVFTRGLKELSIDSLETVLELINANSLYRGAEHKDSVKNFLKLKKEFDKVPAVCQAPWILYTAKKVGPSVRFKNTVIGTLIEDLSSGVDLERAVASFESKVAPQNYKRTTALVTPRMVADAQKKLTELGLLDSLDRRFAHPSDINVQNLLYSATVSKPLNVFDELSASASAKAPKTLAKVDEISLEKFVKDILPTVSSVEVLFEGRFKANMMSLMTAVDPNSAKLFKWDNHFSWAYPGNVADAIKENVKSKGGDTEGDFRASVAWYNADDIDLSVEEPDGTLIYFSSYRGGRKSPSGGTLDLDMNGIDKHCDKEPVENIIYKTKSKMKKGEYRVFVTQYNKRVRKDEGFTLQIEMDGQIHNFTFDKAFTGYKDLMVTIYFDGTEFSIKHVNPVLTNNGSASKEVAGITTNNFIPVTMVMNSPNLWDGEQVGNDHIFFILDKYRTEEPTRGFFNEFLKPELTQHRKVLEILGDKVKVTPNEQEQVGGIGFNLTTRNKFTVRVKGKTQRTYVVNI